MKSFKRISLLLREDQYDKIQDLGLNLSGLVRDLIDDRLTNRQVVITASSQTRSLYDHLISNCGATDHELEQCLLSAMDSLLETKIKTMEKMRSKIRGSK